MNDGSLDISKKLRLGVDAARAGQKNIALVHLTAVLQEEPDNIPAMFWLAYVSPSPQDSVRLLERILELDPNNERAKSGMHWARGRLAAESEEGEEEPKKPRAPSHTKPLSLADGEALRQRLLSGNTQEKDKKGMLAHRARRTIDSITILLVIIGALGLLTLGLGVLSFVPTDTLAAWLPVPTPVADLSPLAVPATTKEASPATFGLSNFPSDGDTIIFDVSQLIEVDTDESETPVLLPIEIAPVPSEETGNPVSVVEDSAWIEPPTLIGPELRSIKPEEMLQTGSEEIPQTILQESPQVVENLLLAHQPAYPGEKWIEVNVTTQQVTAWEGDVPVFTFMASTGLPYTPTVLGEYHIYWKLESTLMTGSGYYLPDVPYTMYFYGGYALHGTYWHNNFGQPMSHGCVNLETGNAQKLFEWAGPVISPGQTQVTATTNNPGTLVVIHQ